MRTESLQPLWCVSDRFSLHTYALIFHFIPNFIICVLNMNKDTVLKWKSACRVSSSWQPAPFSGKMLYSPSLNIRQDNYWNSNKILRLGLDILTAVNFLPPSHDCARILAAGGAVIKRNKEVLKDLLHTYASCMISFYFHFLSPELLTHGLRL